MAQKNLLPLILLGLLETQDKTGYDLKKEFDQEIGEFWSAKHSQVYVELKRMEANNEITSVTGFYGNKIEKTYYKITDYGREILDNWRTSLDDEIHVVKDEFILKLYFIHNSKDPSIPLMLNTQLSKRKQKLKHLEDRMNQVFPNKTIIENNYGHYLILKHAISRESEYVKWLQEALEELPKK